MSRVQVERGYPAREEALEKLRRWVTNDRVSRRDVILFLVKILQASTFWLFSKLKNDKKKKTPTLSSKRQAKPLVIVYVSMRSAS